MQGVINVITNVLVHNTCIANNSVVKNQIYSRSKRKYIRINGVCVCVNVLVSFKFLVFIVYIIYRYMHLIKCVWASLAKIHYNICYSNTRKQK